MNDHGISQGSVFAARVQDEPRGGTAWFAETFYAVVIFLATALVHSQYFSCEHYNDDYQYLRDAGRYHVGEMSLPEYLILPQNEHCMPVWRVWYYLQWRAFGLDPRPWHAVIALVQFLSGYLLFAVLRHYLATSAALVAGALWGAVALGSWDNPMALIAASHFALAAAGILGASFCVTKISGPNPVGWTLGMGLCLLLSLLTMGSMLLVAPALLLQWWWLEGGKAPTTTWGRYALVGFAWFVPVSAVAGLQWYVILSTVVEKTASMNQGWTIREVCERGVSVYAIALSHLWFVPTDRVMLQGITYRIAFAWLFALITLLVARPHARRLWACLLFLTLGFTLAACATRLFLEMDFFLNAGRYRFLPTLWWCAAIAIALDGILSRLPQVTFRWQPALTFALGLLLVTHQYYNAGRTAALFQVVVATPNEGFAQIAQSLRETMIYARAQQLPVVLPDVEIDMLTIRMRLSDVCVSVFGSKVPEIIFVPPSQFLPKDLPRALLALQTAPAPVGPALMGMVREAIKEENVANEPAKSRDLKTKLP